jgi:hypothetical protein
MNTIRNENRTVRLAQLLNKQGSGGLNRAEQTELSRLRSRLGNNPTTSANQQNRRNRRRANQLANRSLAAFPPLGARVNNRYYANLSGPAMARQGGAMYRVPTSQGARTSPMDLIGNRRDAALQAANGIPSPSSELGTTKDGQDWAMAALHPCGPEAPMNVGLPDTVSCAVTTPHYRGEFEIPWDTSLFSTAPDTAKQWSVQVVTPPIPEIALMWRLHDDTNDVWSRWRVARTPGFELPSGVYNGSTVGKTLRGAGYNKYRIVAKGETFCLNANDFNNQGRVIAGQLELETETDIVTIAAPNTTGSELQGGNSVERVLLKVPNTPQYLVATCPRAFQAQAKEGCYMVHKFDTPLLGYDFTRTGDNQSYGYEAITGVAPAINGPESFLSLYTGDDPNTNALAAFDDASYAHYNGYFGYSNITDRNSHPWVSAPSGVLTGVTFFTGLALDGVASVPSIRVKTRLYLECLATSGAAVAPFSHPAPLRDMVAIDRVVGVMQCYDDGYPESYNDFGDILGSIWDGIKTIGSTVLNGARILTGIADSGTSLGAIASTVLPMLI